MTEEKSKEPVDTEPYVKLRGWRALNPIGSTSNKVANVGSYLSDGATAAGFVTEIRLYLHSGLVCAIVNNGLRPKGANIEDGWNVVGEQLENRIWISGGSGAQLMPPKKESK